MTQARANRINRIVFFTVVAYVALVCVAVGLGDRGVMASAAQALVVVPFAIIAAVCGAVVLAYLISVVFGLIGLIGTLLCLIVWRRDLALRLSDKINAMEQRIADAILPPKDQDG